MTTCRQMYIVGSAVGFVISSKVERALTIRFLAPLAELEMSRLRST